MHVFRMGAHRFMAPLAGMALLVPTPGTASETQTFSYDELGRLKAVQYSGTVSNGQAHSLCYDPAGNRTKYKSDSAGALATCTSRGGGGDPPPGHDLCAYDFQEITGHSSPCRRRAVCKTACHHVVEIDGM